MDTSPQSRLAFLLALNDFPGSLDATEKENIKNVAKDLEMQPKAWKDIEPHLLQIIAANPTLKESYQRYINQLDQKFRQSQTIPFDYLPQPEALRELANRDSAIAERGFKPTSQPESYEDNINNTVIVVGQSDQPEKTAKKLGFANKLKQYLKGK